MTNHKVNLNPYTVSIFKGEAFEAPSVAMSCHGGMIEKEIQLLFLSEISIYFS